MVSAYRRVDTTDRSEASRQNLDFWQEVLQRALSSVFLNNLKRNSKWQLIGHFFRKG